MSGLSTQQSLRKALGAIKDTTTVGLAKVNSEYKDLDIAVVKATNHVECPPKEKHVRTIFSATSAARPRADVAYSIHALAKRLSKTHNWTVALKTLIVIHRTLREGDPTFREELINYTRSRGLVFNLSNFKDDSSPEAWDYSAFVRSYALYLEERLECFRVLKYDLDSERSSRTKELDTVDLLEHLPAMQEVLYRLMGCQPEGAAFSNHLIQYALSLVLKESIKLYQAMNDGMINLVDKFFEMKRHDATRALDIYRRAGQQTEKLSEFYEVCKGLDFSRSLKFPPLEQPPQSFLSTMEEYVRDAPRQSSAVRRDIMDKHEVRAISKVPSIPAIEYKPPEPEEPPPPVKRPVEEIVVTTPVPSTENIDLLGLGEPKIDPAALEESNALALAIVPSVPSSTQTSYAPDANTGFDNKKAGGTGWELALVTNPSSNGSALSESKLAGGLDRLTLESLYDDAMGRHSYSTQAGYYGTNHMGPNPFASAPMMLTAQQDPFLASNKVTPPPNVQMAAFAHQQQAMMMQQQQMIGVQPMNLYAYGMPYAPPLSNQPQVQMRNNPFGNPGLL